MFVILLYSAKESFWFVCWNVSVTVWKENYSGTGPGLLAKQLGIDIDMPIERIKVRSSTRIVVTETENLWFWRFFPPEVTFLLECRNFAIYI